MKLKHLTWMIVPFALLTLAPTSASARQVVDKTKDAVVKDTKVVVNKTKDGLSKTGEVMTDAWITTRVHERFVGEDLLKDSDINVDTSRHVVTLSGTVMGRAGRNRATRVAARTEGVHRVVNRLTIGPKHND
jgi:hyperosmotically inducible periplasmic protein